MSRKDSLTRLRRAWPDVLTGLALLGCMTIAACSMLGCASTRVTPAENASKVSQTDSPARKVVKLTIGQPVPKESK